MRHIAFAFTVLCALACMGAPPAGECPPGRAVVLVQVDYLFAEEHLHEIRAALDAMGHLGPEFRLTRDPGARVTLAPAVTDCASGYHFDVASRTAYVDAYCAPSPRAFRAMVAHTIGRAMGLKVVCFGDGKAACSPVGRDTAMMNELPATTTTDEGAWHDRPTELDVLEYARSQEQ